MALVSPGVQVTVVDQSNYAPTALGSIAYVLLATAENKLAPGGTSYASGTLKENAGKLYNVTSQRDIVTTFGTPNFYTTTGGSPINGDERNEYGLMAAYSALGVSNNMYVQRADVDLGQLTGTTVRPLADPADGSWWLDTVNTNWGIYEWSQTTQDFTLQSPIVITSNALVAYDGVNYTPLANVGTIGSYAVVAITANSTATSLNNVFYKTYNNAWQLVGNTAWQANIPTIVSASANVASFSANGTFYVGNSAGNLTAINVTTLSNVTTVNASINANSITGITSRVDSTGRLVLSASWNGSTGTNTIVISANTINGNAALASTTGLGISQGTYTRPYTAINPYYTVPQWQSNASATTYGQATGSIWQKASVLGAGLTYSVKKYNAGTDSWIAQTVNDYNSYSAATFGNDPTNGGLNIPVGAVAARYAAKGDGTPSSFLLYRKNSGATYLTGTTVAAAPSAGDTFTIAVRPDPTSANVTTYNVSITTGTVEGFITAVSAANIPDVSASLDDSGAYMVLTHDMGGDLTLTTGTGTPLANVGIFAGTGGSTNTYAATATGSTQLVGSNWAPLYLSGKFTSSKSQPYIDPANNRLWYYNTPNRVDLLVNDLVGGTPTWRSYGLVSRDVRGYNLTQTQSTGPILSATSPTTSDYTLVYGDIWLDTSNLENYPSLYRWQSISGIDQWVKIDNTDNTSQNGILFADARWGTSSTTNPVSDPIPSITALRTTANAVDLDCPSAALYPRGMILFNTRASGYNVKQWKSNYFTAAAYPNQSLPSYQGTWVSVSGFGSTGNPNFGRKAVRGYVVAALKSVIDSSTALREEANNYNLIVCPGYPELIPNMVNLNNDRNNTAFVVGDSPLRLKANGTDVQAWATNSASATQTGEDGLATQSPYVGVYYPSGQTNDLGGNSVVVPPSHAALRAIFNSDNKSYPWLAPAGSLRGLIDNLNSIGYVDPSSGAYVSVGVNQGLRDILYTNKINPFTYLPSTGLVVYGQKTLSTTPSALDRINVARLVNYLRSQLTTLSRPYLFEPNDPITRNAIRATVSSLLNDIVAKRGITDYLVVCDGTNNTADRIARNELYVDVAIQPTKDVEFIYIPIRLKNTGEIQGGNVSSSAAVGTGA